MIAHDQQRDKYNAGRGDARMSVTQLLSPPRILILRKQHDHEIEDDVSQRTWAMMGSAIHNLLEEACKDQPNHLAEERIEITLDGWKISGQVDVQVVGNTCEVIDWKFTSSWKYLLKQFKDWEEQLNCYAYLIRKGKGWDIDNMSVVMFVRDFMKTKADTTEGYPPSPVVRVPISLWDITKQEEFLRHRIHVHKDALRAVAWGEEPPLCTDEERWKRASDWAARKPDNKNASKVGAKQDVQDWLDKRKDAADYVLEEREDVPTRCRDNYCNVNEWCNQWQTEKKKWTSQGKTQAA